MLQAIYTLAVFSTLNSMEFRGQFGDLFGGANALFTGLAFAGVIYTIMLQRTELKLQRLELSSSRLELSRTADAHTRQVELTEEHRQYAAVTHSLDILFKLTERFENGRGLKMRGRTAELLLKNIEDGKLQQWDSKLVEVVEMLNYFEYIGFLTNNGMLKIDLVANEFGPRIRALYRVCEPAIKDAQSKFGRWTFAELEKLYDKVTEHHKKWADDHGEEFVEIGDEDVETFLGNEKKRWESSGD